MPDPLDRLALAQQKIEWACIHKIATGDSDLINVRFALLC